MAASGNDFIIIDAQRNKLPDPLELFIQRICSRRLSVGADGLLVVSKSKFSHVKVTYYNSDGSTADLCLNGTRCAARFAFKNVMAPRKMKIETGAGVFRAEVLANGVSVDLKPTCRSISPVSITIQEEIREGYFVDVGVPHLIIIANQDLEELNFLPVARMLRSHPDLPPGGANVSFVHVEDEQLIRIRTYERGVEDEMLSCSSGSWAAVMALLHDGSHLRPPIQILPKSLIPLNFHFKGEGSMLSSLTLIGEARFIFSTEIAPEAWNWGA